MRNHSLALGILTALFHGAGYVLYNVQIQDGTSTPNPVSWGLWAIMAVLNMISYQKMTNWVKALQFWIGSVGAMLSFISIVFIGAVTWPTWWEWIVIALGTASAIALFASRHAPFANLLALAAGMVGMIPTLIGVIETPSNEAPIPWIMWTVAFACTLINVLSLNKEERNDREARLGAFTWVPAFNAGVMMLAHLAVVPLCLR